ncbi:HD-GYP domain-containing protein, partial [Clostridioides difficile]|uniref:HD-GYP domain-containing protein n=1 Tax=Clostridioides difficile TaxID=1496 RepID=UPI003AA984B2
MNKPGRLTVEEFDVIKKHSKIGAKMLQELSVEQQESSLVKVAYEICRWHHERYDGNGYPDGLKGEEIPISAQVV